LTLTGSGVINILDMGGADALVRRDDEVKPARWLHQRPLRFQRRSFILGGKDPHHWFIPYL